MREPKVTISIANWNGKEDLYNCLKSIKKNTIYESHSITVIENGSSDGSTEMVESEFPEVRIIKNKRNRGFSKAHNQVLVEELNRNSEYVLLLNNDTIITDEGWLTKLIKVGEQDQKIGIVGCKVVESDGSLHSSGEYFPLLSIPFISSRYNYNRIQKDEDPEEYELVDCVIGAVFLINMDLVRSIGTLDEDYSPAYAEESDYCARAWSAGFKVAYTDSTKVSHKREQTSNELDSDRLMYIKTRNRAMLIFTNFPLTWTLLSIPYIIISSFLVFIEYDGNNKNVCFREETKKDPLRSLRYFKCIYSDLLRSSISILLKKRKRTNVKKTTK